MNINSIRATFKLQASRDAVDAKISSVLFPLHNALTTFKSNRLGHSDWSNIVDGLTKIEFAWRFENPFEIAMLTQLKGVLDEHIK
jgi:hypothetical protein